MRYLIIALLVTLTNFNFAQNNLGNPPGTVDGLTLLEGANQLLAQSRPDNVQATSDGKGIELVSGATAGSLSIPIVAGNFPFNEAIPSWNGWASQDAGFRVWMKPVLANQTPTAWFDAGTWGKVNDELTTRVIPLNCGFYNIDTLLLREMAQGVSVRFDLVRANPASPSPKLYLFALSYTNSSGNQQLARKFTSPPQRVGKSVQLKVPYRSQVVNNSKIIGRICSPCSIAMSLAYFGVNRDTQDIATRLYDPASNAFGVWHRSIQGASQEGVRGYITRFRNWGQVADELAKGHVISASIRFKAGEVNDPMVQYGRRKNGTEGHLVLITGVQADGTVTIHDTASKDYGVNSLWKQDDFGKAWFDKGGVGYLLTGPRR